jgi:hypothetical protein
MKPKRVYPHRVAMYFNKSNLQVYERLENISKVTGLSISKISGMALRYGVSELEERLIQPSEKISSGVGKKKSTKK